MSNNRKLLERAIYLLKQGEPIISPTDTVYGILADSLNEESIRKVYSLKKRPLNLPLIILVSSIEMAMDFAEFSEFQKDTAIKFWIEEKAPITIILKAKDTVSKLINSGKDSVGIRLPNNRFCIDLINGLGRPVVAPSANISGDPTGTSYEMVKRSFGDKVKLIIDGGICQNQPSTIIDLTEYKRPMILRGENKDLIIKPDFF